MNEPEVFEMFKVMREAWPSYKIDPDRLEGTIRTWAEVLAEVPAGAAMLAVKHQAKLGGFAPSIAEIIHVVETHGWNLERALRECRPWAHYVEQAQFANGSGYGADRPSRGLPPKVTRLLQQVNPSADGWEERFRWAWKDAAPR